MSLAFWYATHMPETVIPAPKERIPLDKEAAQLEFEKSRQWIVNSINEHSLQITPEEYWKRFIESIQFIHFDEYIELVDKVIATYATRKKIVCYYPHHEKFMGEGAIPNSEAFMIRLLNERIADKGLEIEVGIISREIVESGRGPKEFVILDDAIYSGLQKREDISGVPADVQINLFVVAATTKGLQSVVSGRIGNPSNTPLNVTSIRALDRIQDLADPELKTILSDVVISKMKQTFGETMGRKMASRFLENPLTMNPFKLPDATSTAALLFGKMFTVPTKDGYIDPQHLLDTNDSRPIREYKPKFSIRNFFRRS